jgi:hypothetical protein
MAAQFAPTQIFHAAASGHARMVQEWLAGGGDPNADAHPHDLGAGTSAYLYSQYLVWQRDPALVHSSWASYFESGAFSPTALVATPNILENGLRLLAVAAWHGRCEVMRLLLAAGAEVNYFNRLNVLHHALMLAVANGQEDAARILVENGADVDYDCANPEHLDPPPEGTYNRNSVPKSAILSGPRILKMLLMAGMDTTARSCRTLSGTGPLLFDQIDHYTPEEYVQRRLDIFEGEDEPTLEMLAAYKPVVESLEMLKSLRLAGWHPLCLSRPFKEFPPFKTLLWNSAFRNGGRVGPRTTEAIGKLFGRNKTGVLADLPDGVFWLIMQFFVAGEMKPHCSGHMPKVGDTDSTPSTPPATAAAPAPAPPGGWHAPAWYLETLHKTERREVITSIARLLLARKRQVLGPTSYPSAEWMENLPGMARRLEESLFRSSVSFEEYRDTSTVSLIRRLQALAKAKLQERNRDADG